MYPQQGKSQCVEKSILEGMKPIAQMPPLQGVLQETLSALYAARQNVDIADAKLFGAKACDVATPCAPDSPNEPIEVLAYKIRDCVQALVKSTASIETRL